VVNLRTTLFRSAITYHCGHQLDPSKAVCAIVRGLVWPEHGHAFEKSPKAPIDHLAIGLVSSPQNLVDDIPPAAGLDQCAAG